MFDTMSDETCYETFCRAMNTSGLCELCVEILYTNKDAKIQEIAKCIYEMFTEDDSVLDSQIEMNLCMQRFLDEEKKWKETEEKER